MHTHRGGERTGGIALCKIITMNLHSLCHGFVAIIRLEKSWIFTHTLSNYDNRHYFLPHCYLSEEAAAEARKVGWDSLQFYTPKIILHFFFCSSISFSFFVLLALLLGIFPSLFFLYPPFHLIFYSLLLRLFCAKVHCVVRRGGVGSQSEDGPWVLQSWQQSWSNLPGQAWRFHLLSLGAPCVWCELSPGITVPFFSANLALE